MEILREANEWSSRLRSEEKNLKSLSKSLQKDPEIPGRVKKDLLGKIQDLKSQISSTRSDIKSLKSQKQLSSNYKLQMISLKAKYSNLLKKLTYFNALAGSNASAEAPDKNSINKAAENPSAFLVLKTQFAALKTAIKNVKEKSARHSHYEISKSLELLSDDNNKIMTQLSYLQNEQTDFKAQIKELKERLDSFENHAQPKESPVSDKRGRLMLTPKTEAYNLLKNNVTE